MKIGRREFLAGLGGMGVGFGLGGVSHILPLASSSIGPAWAPGKEDFVPSTCLLCPSHCGIRGRVVDGSLVRVDGNPLHPISRGGLCPKGKAGIQMLYHPGRLTGPIERTGPRGSDDFRRISWDEALARVTARLADLRGAGKAGSAAWLTGDTAGIMDELIRRFARLYGTPLVLKEDYADGSADVMKLCQGIDSPPAFDLSTSDMVLSFGAALSEAWWGLPQAAQARNAEAGRRPRWIQVDVRHSRTAARADEWLPVRPGTHGALAMGLAYVILKEGLYDAKAAREMLLGIEDWQDESGTVQPGLRTLALRHGRTEEVSRRTGLPAERIVALAKSFGAARRAVAVWDQTVSWRRGGLSDALAIHALNMLVGALNRPGGVLVQPELPVAPFEPRASEEGRGGAGEPPPSLTARDWAAKVAAAAESPIQALFLYYANPVASSPDPDEVARALERIPLVVSFSPFFDESARHADLVLPDHTYLERWQDAPAPACVPIPVWGVVRPMVPPLHDTRATGDLILALASGLGGEIASGMPWEKVETMVEERGKALASAQRGGVMSGPFRREELRALEARGWWVPHGQSPGEFWESLQETGGWFDPYYDYHDRSVVSRFADGKVWVFPAEARRRLGESGEEPGDGFLAAAEDPPGEDENPDYPLRLVPYRVMTLASGATPLMPWLLENLGVLTEDAWETWAEINPETAKRLGLSSHQMVRVESAAGAFVARLRTYVGAQPGVLNVPYGLHTAVEGWGKPHGANPLRAVGASADPTTGLPDWYSTRVRVVPA